MEIFVRPDGSVNHILVDGFSTAFLGKQVIRRASYIEPTHPALRILFHVIRTVVSDNSATARWTRRWPCQWRVNLQRSGGPIMGPFKYRVDAITAEIYWINNKLANTND